MKDLSVKLSGNPDLKVDNLDTSVSEARFKIP